MKSFLACLSVVVGTYCPVALAQSVHASQGALQLLQKVAMATNSLDYSGTFVYRRGNHSETSRIMHVSSNGTRIQKLEVLDGSPREVIRRNGAVECYLPDERLVIVEQRSAQRAFPALLPVSLASLVEYYHIRLQGEARIAGIDSQIVRLDPKDEWRHGHKYWIDTTSGLLLKADVLDGQGQVLESMAFTELRIGKPDRKISVKSDLGDSETRKDSWTVRQAKLSDLRDDANWVFRDELPGFRRHAAMRRGVGRGGVPAHEVLHWVYSDGLAAYSIFIAPASGTTLRMSEGVEMMGAIGLLKRVVDGHEVVVMGDLPSVAIRRIAEGIGRNK